MSPRKTKQFPVNADQKVSADRVKAYIRTRFNPIRNLTPELLAQHLDSFSAGYLKQAALIWDSIENRDDTLKSVIPKRKKALSRNGYEIVTVKTSDESLAEEASRQKEVLENFWNNITVTNALDENEKGEVSLLVRQMMDAMGKRYAVHEIVWKPGASLTAEFRFVPLWFFENTTGRLRYLASDASLLGEDLEAGKWLITVGDGLMYACSIAYMYKNLSLKDWIIYSERHGMPGIHGKTKSQKDSDEWTDLVEAVENFAADWAIVTNEGATIEKVDLSTAGQLPYPPLVDRMSRAMAAIWRGADLSTMSQGQGTGASLQGDEMILLEQDDAQFISETLRRQVERTVLKYYFGEDVVPLAYMELKTSKKQNTDQDLKIDETLHSMGAPIPVKSLLERYSRAMPEEGEELLEKPAQQPGLNPPSVLPNRRPAPSPARRFFNSSISANLRPSSLRSEATADTSAVTSDLISSGNKQVAQAIADDLQPLRSRLETIMQVEDEQLRNAALLKLQADLPAMLLKINANPASAKTLEDTLAAAMLNGMAGGAA